jgi:type II secretory pathway pseudopilin PulG
MRNPRYSRGAILLEVVLALALFVAAAAVLTTALNSSLDSVQKQRRNLHASNLALSLLAELQMGARSPLSREAFALEAPFENWTAEIIATPAETEIGETNTLTRVEVVVRDRDSSMTYRVGQLLNLGRVDQVKPSTQLDSTAPAFSSPAIAP